MALYVKLLEVGAKAPTVAHPGEDLGYDVYALEDTNVGPWPTKVRTGISVEASDSLGNAVGLIVKDRSSMALSGMLTHGGVIDAGYRGEIVVLMSTQGTGAARPIKAGTKIAQLVPVPVLTSYVYIVEDLAQSGRGDKGFGSSGQ